MEVDIAMLLGAIIENGGGTYELPLEVLERVSNDETERGIVIDHDTERDVLVLTVVPAEDLGLDDEDE